MGKRSRKAASQRSDRLFAEFEQAVTKAAQTSKRESATGPGPRADRASMPGAATRDD
jgi:hypothetical protein